MKMKINDLAYVGNLCMYVHVAVVAVDDTADCFLLKSRPFSCAIIIQIMY